MRLTAIALIHVSAVDCEYTAILLYYEVNDMFSKINMEIHLLFLIIFSIYFFPPVIQGSLKKKKKFFID